MAAEQTTSGVVGPAKWAAVAVISACAGAGLTWSLMRPKPLPVVSPPNEVVLAPPAARTLAPKEPAPATPAPEEPAKATPLPVPAPAPDTAPAAAAPKPPEAGGPRRLDINKATAAELELLPGIGPEAAKHIIEYRRANGPFKSLDDLDKVKGIGPKTIEKLRPLAQAGA